MVFHALHRNAGLWLFVHYGFHELLFVAGAGLLRVGDSLAGAANRLDRCRAVYSAGDACSPDRLSLAAWHGRLHQDQSEIGGLVENAAAVGGDVVRARLAALRGAPIPTAAASVLVDITLGVFVQIGFTLLGLGLIVSVTGHQGFIRPTLIGAVIGVLAIIGFYVVQRLGMFRFIGKMISRLANADDWHSLVHSGQSLDEAIRRQYARRRGVTGCCAWTAASLVLGSGEIWIALHALSLHATVVNAVILQSMVLTIRSAVFPVPGALGVQEGGYVVIGNLLGIPGDAAFALSLIARVRELILGIPGLICWQMVEARRLWQARLATNAR